MSTYDKVKILIVGDSGVGKTSALHCISNGCALLNPSWTIGCSIEVKLHDYKTGTPSQKSYFVELWDIGGSSTHMNSRSIFYNAVNGIILTHDLTNRKSELNLQKWLMEILNHGETRKIHEEHDFDPEIFVGSGKMIPILVIGTKSDIALKGRRPSSARTNTIAEEFRSDEILVNCLDPKSFAPGSTGAVALSRFFDSVIDRRFYRQSNQFYSERRRL